MLYKQWHRSHLRVQDIAWINSYFYPYDITHTPKSTAVGVWHKGLAQEEGWLSFLSETRRKPAEIRPVFK